jgi:hypothetical protein
VIVIFYNDLEFIACNPSDEKRVTDDFFKTRERERFKRVAVGDFAYVRATAAKIPWTGATYGSPSLLVTTNLSDHKL